VFCLTIYFLNSFLLSQCKFIFLSTHVIIETVNHTLILESQILIPTQLVFNIFANHLFLYKNVVQQFFHTISIFGVIIVYFIFFIRSGVFNYTKLRLVLSQRLKKQQH